MSAPLASGDGTIYLDHAATTPLLPEVRAAMEPYLGPAFGNPSSLHAAGRRARRAVERAREQVAASVGAPVEDVVFCASGSEANNTLARGFVAAHSRAPLHVVASAVEHPCLDAALRAAADASPHVEVTWIAPRSDGVVDAADFVGALRPHTRLATLMAVNNETGAAQPIDVVGEACAARGIFFHVDACQALGRVDIAGLARVATSLTLCAHKAYGPKGSAALVIRPEVPMRGLIVGGHQEAGRRAGTEDVAAIVGFGVAAELAGAAWEARASHARACEDALLAALDRCGIGWETTVPRGANVPGILNLAIEGLTSAEVLIGLDLAGIAISTGSACQSGRVEPSRVLGAMGLAPERLRRAFRVSVGLANAPDDLVRVASELEMLASRRKLATQ